MTATTSFRGVGSMLLAATLVLAAGGWQAAMAESTKPADGFAPTPGALEVPRLRTQSSKTFANPDGTRTWSAMAGSVHYQDRTGAWDEIDVGIRPLSEQERYEATLPAGVETDAPWRSLADPADVLKLAADRANIDPTVAARAFAFSSSPRFPKPDTRSPLFSFGMTKNAYRSYFAADASSPVLAKFATGNWSVSFGIEGARKGPVTIAGNTITYHDVYPDTDLRFTTNAEELREEIILHAAPAKAEWSFPLYMENVRFEHGPNGSLDFVDATVGERIWSMPKPFMFDTLGSRSDSVSKTVETKRAETRLVVHAEREWLLAPARGYPVAVDPTFSQQPSSQDTTIFGAAPNDNNGAQVWIAAGPSTKTNWGLTQAFVAWNMSSAPTGAVRNVSNSCRITLTSYSSAVSGSPVVECRLVSTSWTEALTYNTSPQPTVGSSAVATATITALSTPYTWSWNGFALGIPGTHGARFGVPSGTATQYTMFYSSEHATSSYRPKLEIDYPTTPNPEQPQLASATSASSLSFSNHPSDNTSNYYAFRVNGGSLTNQYVQSGGGTGASPYYATPAGWTQPKPITGLTANTPYTIDAVAAQYSAGTLPSTGGAYYGIYGSGGGEVSTADKWTGDSANTALDITSGASNNNVALSTANLGGAGFWAGGMTLEGWVKVDSGNENNCIVGFCTTASDSDPYIMLYLKDTTGSSAQLAATWRHTNGVAAVTVATAAGVIAANTWYHVAFSVPQGASQTATLYVNGSSVATATVKSPTSATNYIKTLNYLGYARINSSYQRYNGSMDEVAIYNKALSSTRLLAHYNAASSTAYRDAVITDLPAAYYRLSEQAAVSGGSLGLMEAGDSGFSIGDGFSSYARMHTLAAQAVYSSTLPTSTPGVYSNVGSTSTCGGSITFTHTGTFGTAGSNQVKEYRYLWTASATEPADWSGQQTWSSGTLVLATVAGADRYLYLRSVNMDGVANTTGSLKIGPFNSTVSAPPAPTAVAASGVGTDTITWNWSAVSGAQYKLWTAATGGTQIDGTLSTNSYTETALDPGTSYTRYVEAFNGCGVSARIPLSAATTLTRSCPNNASFEATPDAYNADGSAAHWAKKVVIGSGGGNPTFSGSSGAHTGSRAQAITWTTASQGSAYVYQKINALGGAVYKINFWHQVSDENGTQPKHASDITGGVTPGNEGLHVPSATYAQADFTVSRPTAGLLTMFVGGAGYYSGTTIRIDDVSIAPADPTSVSVDHPSFCESEYSQIQLTLNGGYNVAAAVKWYKDPGCTIPVSGGNSGNPLITSDIPTAGQSITYYGRYEDASLCVANSATQSVTVTVTALQTYYHDGDADTYGDAADSTQACSAPVGYVSNSTDCDDTRADVHPGAAEVCDGADNDCDGQTDEGVKITFYQDADTDTYGNVAVATEACTAPVGYVSNSTDCNDIDAAINPAATEVCDGVDNNCDGATDEGVKSTFYQDADSDTYGNLAVTTQACVAPAGYVSDSTDCNDARADVHPGAAEVCDGADNDCDGATDEGVKITFYEDSDTDAYGNPAATVEACSAPTGYVTDNTDCDDTRAAVHPNAAEVCDGLDNDCDGTTDEGVKITFYQDGDTDTFGNAADSLEACSAPAGYVGNGTDCDDTNAAINPAATEVHDGVDNDCDTFIDEGVSNIYYRDFDEDTYGDPAVVTYADSPPEGYVADNTDCNDADAAVHPGATETCNGVDDDCDGATDEGVKTTFYEDSDADTYGNADAPVEACVAPEGYVSNSTDCNDAVAAIHPGAVEVCDGVDNNCNGETDEGVKSTFYHDGDLDTYGDPSDAVQACALPEGYVTNNQDCDDANAAVNPGAAEICDGLDNDCDLQVDEGVKNTYYHDVDLDTYGDPSAAVQACTLPAGYVTNNQDCNDGNADVHPGATEICDGIDNNCDLQVDEGVTTIYYRDADGDTYGDPLVTVQACALPDGYVANNLDCNDGNPDVHPGATEVCDGVDNDCDGQTDEELKITYYRDVDDDSYGVTGDTQDLCGPIGDYTATQGGDCNDANAAVHPGAAEICDGVDNDCDLQVDEDIPQAPSSPLATPASICAGESATLSAVPGSGGDAVEWFTGSCGGTPVTSPVSPGETTTFYARTRNTATGCVSAACASVEITVIPLPVAPTSAASSRDNFCASDTGNISLTAVGGAGTTLKWYTGGCGAEGGGTAIGEGSPLQIASPEATTTYYARWENTCGASTCASVVVTVHPLPELATGGTSAATSTTQIVWGWTKPAGSGYRFDGYDHESGPAWIWPSTIDASSYTEINLTPNTQYQRWVQTEVPSTGCASAGRLALPARYTLAKAGIGADKNLTCDKSTGTSYPGGTLFSFSNPAGFGTGGEWKASSFEYVWNTSASEAWSSPRTAWGSGTLAQTPTAGGDYYLHVRAVNGDGAANSAQAVDYGPFQVSSGLTISGTVSFSTLSEASWPAFGRVVTFVVKNGAGAKLATLTPTLTFTNNPGTQTASATYSLAGIPAEARSISAKTAWHLRQKIAFTPEGATVTADFTLLGGDLNNSNSINVEDYVKLKLKWNSTESAVDINGDGSVQLLDYNLMKANWFVVGQGE